MSIECYSEESDDEDEADTAEMSAENMDQLTPGSLHVSNRTLYANLNRPITVRIKSQHLTLQFIVVYMCY